MGRRTSASGELSHFPKVLGTRELWAGSCILPAGALRSFGGLGVEESEYAREFPQKSSSVGFVFLTRGKQHVEWIEGTLCAQVVGR